MEFNGNCKPENSIWIPFIRGAVGPLDYTPGPMICYQPEYHHGDRPYCTGVGTKAYHLAAFVLFESNLQMLMDNPCRYDEWPDCRDFITSVPVNWDETLDFLPEGKSLQMTSFVDGLNADIMAMDYRMEQKQVDKETRFTIKMTRNGGFAASLN